MKNKVFSVFAAIAFAGTMVAAQDPQPRPTPTPSPASPSQPQSPSTQSSISSASETKDQSLTGCLVQGSGPTVFLLENAKIAADISSTRSASPSGQSTASSVGVTGKTYVVSAIASSVDLKSQLNHQVTITGTGDAATASASAPAPAQNARMSEKDMPKFSAKTVTKIADTCSNAG